MKRYPLPDPVRRALEKLGRDLSLAAASRKPLWLNEVALR
jgi:hypothetical protein